MNAKVGLGPPGVDTELFEAIAREDGPERLRDLADELESGEDAEADGESSWDRDPRRGRRSRALACGDRRARGSSSSAS